MMGDLGWQDQGCLQHTNMSLPCGVKHQGSLAAKWWGHGVCHIGVYGTHYMQLTWCWHDPGQWADQLGWSGLYRDFWIHRGATHYLQLWCWLWHGVRPFPFCWHLEAAVLWYMLHCTVGHRCNLPLSLLGGCLLQLTTSRKSSTYVGASLVLTAVWVVAMVVALAWMLQRTLILRAVVLTYIYGIGLTIPARVVAVAPR